MLFATSENPNLLVVSKEVISSTLPQTELAPISNNGSHIGFQELLLEAPRHIKIASSLEKGVEFTGCYAGLRPVQLLWGHCSSFFNASITLLATSSSSGSKTRLSCSFGSVRATIPTTGSVPRLIGKWGTSEGM